MNARKILASVFFNYLGAITVSLAGFVATPIVLGHLGKATYGAWALIAAIIGYSSLLDLGVGLTVMRMVAERSHVSDRDELRRIVSTGLVIYGAAGFVVVVAGIAASGELGHAFHLHGALLQEFTVAFIIMMVALGLTFPAGLYTGLNQGLGRFREQNMIVIGQTLAGTAVTIAIVLLGGGLIPLAIGWAIIASAGFGVKIVYAARAFGILPAPRRFDRRLGASLLAVSSWMFLINMANKVIWNTDTIIVGSVLGAVAVAHYAVALGPATAVRSVTDQFNSVTYTAAASLRAQDQIRKLQRLLLEATRVVVSCIGPFVVLFLLWGNQFLRLWVGPSFISSTATLVVLVIGMLSSSVQATASQILLAFGRQRTMALVAVVEATVNVGASIALAHSMGIEGVALGTTVPTTLTAFGFYLPYAARLLSVPLDDVLRRLAMQVLLCTGVYLVMRFGVPAIRFSSLATFCVFAVAFVGVLMVTGILLEREERHTYVAIVRAYRRRATRYSA